MSGPGGEKPMEYTYSAFISYRHLPADMAAARAVQQALETYRIPADIRKKTGRKKLNRCFRDQDELPLADDLGASIEKALRESEWLIVICSPDLPASVWCLREVDFFIELGRRDRIIPVLISGEPSESYPPRITAAAPEEGGGEVEPLAADLRGNLRKQLKTEKLRLAARMLNLNFNDLRKRERERALRRGLILVSGALAGVIGFTAYNLYQNHLLTEERNATARNATELLIEKSVRSTSEGDLGSGLTYALEAYDGSRLFANEYDVPVSAALEAAMYPQVYSQIGFLKDNGILHRHAALSNDGKLIACRQADDSLQVYNSVNGEKRYTIRQYNGLYKYGRDFSPDSRYVNRFTEDTVTLYSSADGTPVLTETLPEGWTVFFSGQTLRNEVPVCRAADGAVGLFDPFTKELAVLEGITLSGDQNLDIMVLHRSGRRGAVSDGSRIWLLDTENRTVLQTVEGSLFLDLGGYTEDEWYFRYWNGSENIFLRWDTLEEACRSAEGDSLSPDGKLLASAIGFNGFTLRDAQTGEELWTEGHNSGNTHYSLYFADNDTLIASHEEVQIYRLSDRATVYDSGKERTTYSLDFTQGRLVMPLRAGGCLINLMPEEQDLLPHMTVETRNPFAREALARGTESCFLTGFWDGMAFQGVTGSDSAAGTADQPGLLFESGEITGRIQPLNGVSVPFIYASPDSPFQAMIRDQAVDIFRAAEDPKPVLTIPGNGYQRLCAAVWGNTLALGSYVENLILYDLETGDCLGSIDTGAMCTKIQFSPDGKHIIAVGAVSGQVTVASTENRAVIMRIPITDVYAYADMTVGFNPEGTEAVVLYPDGHADVGLMVQGLDSLVEKARQYTR